MNENEYYVILRNTQSHIVVENTIFALLRIKHTIVLRAIWYRTSC